MAVIGNPPVLPAEALGAGALVVEPLAARSLVGETAGVLAPLLAEITPVAPPVLAEITPVAPPLLAQITPVASPVLAEVLPVAPAVLADISPITPSVLAEVAAVAPAVLVEIAHVTAALLAESSVVVSAAVSLDVSVVVSLVVSWAFTATGLTAIRAAEIMRAGICFIFILELLYPRFRSVFKVVGKFPIFFPTIRGKISHVKKKVGFLPTYARLDS